MKKVLLICILFLSQLGFSQDLLVTEDFESDGIVPGRYQANDFDDSSNDVWTRTDSPNGPNNNFTVGFSFYSGGGFWGGEDVDATENPLGTGQPGHLMLKTIDVSGYQGGTIQVKVLIAAREALAFESVDYLQFAYAFDGNIASGANSVGGLPSEANLATGTYNTFGAFYGLIGTTTQLHIDSDLDGIAEGGGAMLGGTFTEYTYTIPVGATQAMMSLSFSALVGGSEDVGIDNIRVYGIAPNVIPKLTAFSHEVSTIGQNTESELTFAALMARGDEADSDGTVDAFLVKTVDSGILKIGASAGAATAYAVSTNDVIDASNNAYWTPATDIEGDDIAAFTVVVLDDTGDESAAAVQVVVDVHIVQVPLFATVQSDPFSLTDSGFRPSVAMADLDNDGDLDLLVGDASGLIKYSENNGTSTEPSFGAIQSSPYSLTDIGSYANATFADLDGDGDFDVIGAERYGDAYYFSNTGTVDAPSFATVQLNPFSLTNIGDWSDYSFADMDNDGDLDAMSGEGESSGNFKYFENIGTTNAPLFGAVQTNPFSLTVVGARPTVSLADLDHDGDMDLLAGDKDGMFYYFENTGTSAVPSFGTVQTNPFSLTDVGGFINSSFVDLDADGDQDLLVGESNGNFKYFENLAIDINFAPILTSFNDAVAATAVDVEARITSGALLAKGDAADEDGTIESFYVKAVTSGTLKIGVDTNTALVFDASTNYIIDDSNHAFWTPSAGQSGASIAAIDVVAVDDKDSESSTHVSASVEVKMPQTPIFAAFVTNPFSLADAGTRSSVGMADLDNDGDLDLMSGDSSGDFKYFENTGSATNPNFATLQTSPFSLTNFGSYSFVSFADLDDDKDYDVLGGEIGGSAFFLENIGTAASPNYDIAEENPFSLTDIGSWSDYSFADMDADGDLDAMTGESNGNFKYFENIGTTTVPLFGTVQTNPFSLTVVGARTNVSLGDLDNDGDFDLIVGESKGDLFYFENIGTPISPNFGAVQKNPFQLSDIGSFSNPTFVDLDDDGDVDVLVAENAGNFMYFENTAIVVPTFTSFAASLLSMNENTEGEITLASLLAQGDEADDGTVDAFLVKTVDSGTLKIGADAAYATAYATSTNDVIDASNNAYWTPDLDAAGVGAAAFSVVAVDNAGLESVEAVIVPVDIFEVESLMSFGNAALNPFSLTDIGEISTVAMVDLDNDGDLDIIAGKYIGYILYLENTGTASIPVFGAAQVNPFNLTDIGSYASVTMADLDGDDDYDLLSGDFDGGFHYFENTGTVDIPSFAAVQINPFSLTDIENYSTPTFTDLDDDGDFDVMSGNTQGEFKYFENIGTSISPAFAAVQTDPFSLEGVGSRSSPMLADIDADGDLDLITGKNKNIIKYFENTGTSTDPVFLKQASHPFPSLSSAHGIEFNGCFGDLDADGDSDLMMGNSLGKFSYIENTSTTNSLPAFTAFADVVGTTDEDVALEITFAAIAAQGNEIDSDGTVDGFVVQTLSNGTLQLGETAGSATDFAVSTNDEITASINAYWTPASNSSGDGIAAFSIKAIDNSGGLSSTPVVLTLDVSAVNDAPELSSSITEGFVENATGTAYTIVATDVETAILTYSLGTGNDEDLFNITDALVTFKSAPDFEHPDDSDTDNDYIINVIASDGELSVDQDVTITVSNVEGAVPLTVTAVDKSKVYGAENPTFTLLYSGFENSDDESVLDIAPVLTSVADANSEVNTYSIVASGGVDDYYSLTHVPGTLTVTKALLSVTANDASKTYGDDNPVLEITYSGFVGLDDESDLDAEPTAATVAIPASNVGDYDITASGGSAVNYSFDYTNGTLTVNKAILSVTAENATKTYGEPNPELEFIYNGFVGEEDESDLDEEPAISTGANESSEVDDYVIIVTGGSAINYSFSYIAGTLTINPAILSVMAENATRIYGDENPSLEITYSGFVGTDDESDLDEEPTAVTVAVSSSNVGDYDITLSEGEAYNYEFNYVVGTLTITKAVLMLSVVIDDASITYGEDLPNMHIEYDEFVGDDEEDDLDELPEVVLVGGDIDAVLDAGEYVFGISEISDSNYSFSHTNGALTVNKAELDMSLSIEDVSRPYGEENPVMEIIYTSGFVGADDESDVDTDPTISTVAIASSDVGEYEIVTSGGAAANYVFNYFTATLTVEKADQEIDFSSQEDKIQGDSSFDLTATGGASGNGVTYVSSNTAVATISGATVTILGAGTTTFTASQAGNGNFLAATPVMQDLVVEALWIWNGAVWNNPTTPTSSDNVLIAGDFTVPTPEELSINNLEVEAGFTLTMAGGSTLDITGDLINDGGLVIASGSSLITYEANSISGNDIVIKRNTRYADGKYSFVGTPMEQNASIVGGDLGSSVYKYNEAIAYDADGINRWETASADELVPGRGYTQANQQEISFTGTPNTGIVTYSGTYTQDAINDNEGWNLVANPYPAAIEVATFLADNTNIEGAIYIWDDNGSNAQRGSNADYIVANGLASINSTPGGGQSRYNQYLGSSQAFFVKFYNDANTDLTFSESMRANGLNGDDSFFRPTDFPTVRLNLINDKGLFKQTVVGFVSDARDQTLNRNYDAQAFDASSEMGLFTLKAGRTLALSGMSQEWETIQLQSNIGESGQYSISIEVEGYDGDLYLMDHQTGVVTDLIYHDYSFSAESGIDTDRFELLSKTLSVLDIKQDNVLVYVDNNILHVEHEDDLDRTYELFNMNGMRLKKKKVSSKGTFDLERFGTGIYLVFDGQRTHKILLK